MNPLIPEPAQLTLTPVAVNAIELAELELTSSLAALQVRATTLTSVMKEILQFRPPFRWEINKVNGRDWRKQKESQLHR